MSIKYLPIIVKFHKAVSIFDYDFTKPAIALEKSFQIPFATIAWDIPDVNTLSTWHNATCNWIKFNLKLILKAK